MQWFVLKSEYVLWRRAVEMTGFSWCRRKRRNGLRMGLEKLSLIWAECLGLTAFLWPLAWRANCCRGYKAGHPSELYLFDRNVSPVALLPLVPPETNTGAFCSRFVCLPVINASVFHSLVLTVDQEGMTAKREVSPFWSLYARKQNTLPYFCRIRFLLFPWI